jgi:hypothetical protein
MMAALLVVCVVLQYNDPDPIRWMAFYGSCAIASALLPSYKRAVPVALLLAIGAIVWSLLLVMGVWDRIEVTDLVNKMSEKGGAVEEGREAGGLAIAGAWLLFASVYRSRRA